jgi:hypothetical protein
MEKNKGGYTGLADLSDGRTGEKINIEDFCSGKHLSDLKASDNDVPTSTRKPTVYNQPTSIKITLPHEYNNRKWDDLYQSNELETIRTKYPEHYEKLRKEKFDNND